MITTTKSKKEAVLETSVPDTAFLKVDGKLVIEDPILHDNRTYVSKEDYNKYGKIESGNGRKEYFLKRYRGGRPGELLVDPYGMFSKTEDLSAYTTQRGHRFCEYIKVSELVFECYVRYLETRDPRYFQTCDKQVKDGMI